MKHDYDMSLCWCRCCGRPEDEIVENDLRECDGIREVVSSRFLKARREANALFNPVVAEVLTLYGLLRLIP